MYSKTYDIKYNDIDKNNTLKPSALFEFLEDIAAVHANVLGFGYDEIYPKGMGWFLLKYSMEFYDYPSNISSLKIDTEPRGANKLFTYRDFYIYNAEKLIGKVASTWALVDLKSASIINPLEKLSDVIKPFEKRENDIPYTKIPQIESNYIQEIFSVKYFDIDVNNHVNNSVYLRWALDTLPVEFLENKKIQKLNIVYKKQITLNNEINSMVSISGDTTTHYLKNNATQEDLCNLLVEWK